MWEILCWVSLWLFLYRNAGWIPRGEITRLYGINFFKAFVLNYHITFRMWSTFVPAVYGRAHFTLTFQIPCAIFKNKFLFWGKKWPGMVALTVIPALRRLRQEDYRFEVILGYKVRHCLTKKKFSKPNNDMSSLCQFVSIFFFSVLLIEPLCTLPFTYTLAPYYW
jgi:hypothetical protein